LAPPRRPRGKIQHLTHRKIPNKYYYYYYYY
jgi:hypothetical protein